MNKNKQNKIIYGGTWIFLFATILGFAYGLSSMYFSGIYFMGIEQTSLMPLCESLIENGMTAELFAASFLTSTPYAVLMGMTVGYLLFNTMPDIKKWYLEGNNKIKEGGNE